MALKTKEETLKAWKEHIVGKTFEDYSDLDCAIADHVGFNSAVASLLSEDQLDSINNFNYDMVTFDMAIKRALNGINDNVYTMRNDANDKDLLYSELSLDGTSEAYHMIHMIKEGMLRQKALEDGVKIKYVYANNPDYEEDDEFEYERPYVRVSNEHLEES